MIRSSSQRQVAAGTEQERDSLSLLVVEDLLLSTGEWREVPNIVRITLKALSEVVKKQAGAILELERQNITNVKLVSLEEYLDRKVNTEDVKDSLGEILQLLNDKPSFEELDMKIQNLALKDDVDYSLSLKASNDEIRELRSSTKQIQREIESSISRAEETSQLIKQLSIDQEVETLRLTKELQNKVSIEELSRIQEELPTKKQVANSLQKKVNKSDFEQLLARKAERADLSNLLQVVESKADQSVVENMADLGTIERMKGILENKADKLELNMLSNIIDSKADRSLLSILDGRIEQSEIDIEKLTRNLESQIESARLLVEEVRQGLTSQINRKAEEREVDKLIKVLANKVEESDLINIVQQVKEELTREVGEVRDASQNIKRQLESAGEQKQRRNDGAIDGLRQEIGRLSESVRKSASENKGVVEEGSQQTKNLLGAQKKEIEKEIKTLSDQLEQMRAQLSDHINQKLGKSEFGEFKVNVLTQLEDKTDLNEVQTALNACQSDVSQRFMEFKDELKTIVGNNENTLLQVLDKKANFAEVQAALASKVENNNLLALLANKVSHSEIDETRKLAERVAREIDQKAQQKDLEQFQEQVTVQVDELSRDMILKANIKDVCSLLDAKANIEDVNKALGDIHRELEKKCYSEELNNIVSDQATINEQLCTENIVARWTWKSGEIRTGSLVPWEVQLVNTLPDNFLWEKEKTNILVVAPGLYEITLGFFAKKKPTIQLLVNGEPIMSAVNTGSYVMHHSSGKIKDIKHSAGVVTGLTLIDFVVLPARARINLTYTGEFGGEGFFGLKRL